MQCCLAGLVETWNAGPVEGQISRLNLLKHTAYMPVSQDLLRCRVLAAAQNGRDCAGEARWHCPTASEKRMNPEPQAGARRSARLGSVGIRIH